MQPDRLPTPPALPAAAGQLPVIWESPIFDYTGYATACRTAVLGLARGGTRLRLLPNDLHSDECEGLNPQDKQLLQSLTQTAVSTGIGVCYEQPIRPGTTFDVFRAFRERHPNLHKYVGATKFETNNLPAAWVHACNAMDEVWVPSRFAQETFMRVGVAPEKLQIVPEAIDLSLFQPGNTSPLPIANRRTFNFLSVFQWSVRKGVDVLLTGYRRAFQAQDDVSLTLRVYSGDGQSARAPLMQLLRELNWKEGRDPTIILLDSYLHADQMPALFAAADAFVLPTRGEGWGLPYMEAMAMGVPCIATRWGGSTEFMTDANSLLLDIDGLVEMDDPEFLHHNPHFRGHRWANPSAEHLAHLMQALAANPQRAREIGARGHADLHQNWGPPRVAKAIAARLQALSAQPARRAHSSAATTTLLKDLPVTFQSAIFHFGGYAWRGRSDITSLHSAGVPVRAVDLTANTFYINQLSASELNAWRTLERRPVRKGVFVVHNVPVSNRGEAVFPKLRQRNPGYNAYVGFVATEVDGAPADWVAACHAMDETWTVSKFVRDALVRSGHDPLRVFAMRPGIDASLYNRALLEALPIAGQRGFTFLSVFEWAHRKGWDVLLRAFFSAFSAADDVCLVLRAYDSHSSAALHERIQEFARTHGFDTGRLPHCIVLNEDLPTKDLPRLYAAADAFVLPSRGEGWAIPCMEAMAAGLPTIATNFGGQLDFMNSDVSYMLDYKLAPVSAAGWNENENTVQYKGFNWAEPSVEHLTRIMRDVFENRAAAASRGRAARAWIAREFTPETGANCMLPRLRALAASAAGGRDFAALRTAMAAHNWPAAAELAAAARAAQPFSGDAYMLAADCEVEAGHTAQALELYRAAALRGNGLAALRRMEALDKVGSEVSQVAQLGSGS